MPTTFHEIITEWQTFYFALGTAAATLTGLLFVAVSLHLDQFAGNEHPELRTVAYKTLLGFVHLLLISLYFLVPRATPSGLVAALILTTALTALIQGRQTPLQGRLIRRTWGWPRFFRRFVVPQVAQAGILVVAILLYFEQTAALPWLVPPAILLLGSGVLNAWDLLVLVGQEKLEDQAERQQNEHPQFRRLEQQLREVTRRQRQITRQQEDTAAQSDPPPRRRG